MPSSLTTVGSITLVYSTLPPALVCGTGICISRYRGFSCQLKYLESLPQRGSILHRYSVLSDKSQNSSTDLPIKETLKLAREFINTLQLSIRVTPALAPFQVHGCLEFFTYRSKIRIKKRPLSIHFARTKYKLYRNINLLSIGYAFRPHLRPD